MIYNAKYIKQFLLKQGMEKPKLRWSYFELPGFVKSKDGFVPMKTLEDDDGQSTIRTDNLS